MHWFCMSVEELEKIIFALETVVWDSRTSVVNKDEVQKLIDKIKFVIEHDK